MKNQIFENLLEITGQESGVIVYGDDVIICNWSSTSLNGLPRLFIGLELISLHEKMTAENLGYSEDIFSEIEDKKIIYDFNNDFPTLENWGGEKFNIYVDDKLEAIVYAPDDWC